MTPDPSHRPTSPRDQARGDDRHPASFRRHPAFAGQLPASARPDAGRPRAAELSHRGSLDASTRTASSLGAGSRQVDPELGFHVTMRLSDDRLLANDAPALRLASRVLLEQGEPRGLLAFRILDTHAHVLLAVGRVEAGRFALYAQSALRKRLRLPTPFEPARLRPIESPRHLRHALRYVVGQEGRHGAAFDPAQDGSCAADYLGLRQLGGGRGLLRLRAWLPRLTSAELRTWAGLVHPAVEPDARWLPEAAAAALGLPSLAGASAAHTRARIAACHAVSIGSSELASLLGVTARAVQRYRLRPAPGALVEAVRGQLRLRSALARRPSTW